MTGIAAGVLLQMILMVLFGGIKLRQWYNFSHDRISPLTRRLDSRDGIFDGLFLGIIGVKNNRAVTAADIIALAIFGRWVVNAKK